MSYVKIVVIYEGKRFKASVDPKSGLDQLKSLFMKKLKLNLNDDYEIVALTDFGLVENSEWKLIAKSKDDLLTDWGSE